MDFIDNELYQTIKEVMPVFCVDLLVHQDGAVLMCKRLNVPAKNNWWLPGGRLHKNESIEGAVNRIAKSELGISVEIERELGFYNLLFENIHTPVVVVITRLANPKCEITLDGQHSDYKFVSSYEDLDPRLAQVISDWRKF